jgi:hypothetical protein
MGLIDTILLHVVTKILSRARLDETGDQTPAPKVGLSSPALDELSTSTPRANPQNEPRRGADQIDKVVRSGEIGDR